MFTHFHVNGWSCVFIVQIKILLVFLQGRNCNRRNLNSLQGQGIISNTGACTLIATGQLADFLLTKELGGGLFSLFPIQV